MTRAAFPLLLLVLAGAPIADRARDLASELERLAAPLEAKGARVGVEVRSLESGGGVLVDRRGGELFSAASNTKLVTGAAAISLLPPDFAFETTFVARGKISGDSLRGDLVVRGGGDPCLSPPFHAGEPGRPLAEAAAAIRAAGIARVEGDLVLDDRLFDREFVHRGWPADQRDQPYAAPVCGLPLNGGCVDLVVTPGRPGESASLAIAPEGAPVSIAGRIATIAGRGKTVVHASFADDATLRVRGEIGAESKPYTARVAVRDPVALFGGAFAAALRRDGVEVAGTVRAAGERDAPDDGRVLHAIRSPLLPALAVIHKRSDNFFAEHLLKRVGAHAGEGGSWAGGVRAVRRFVEGAGVSTEGFAMEDGSGLSRGNRFTPRFLASLLEAVWRGPRRDEFLRTMASPGETDTTLERRLREEPFPHRVRAKTGYIRRVSALSGFARTRGEEPLAFTILVNDGGGKLTNDAFKGLQDAIVRRLVDLSRERG